MRQYDPVIDRHVIEQAVRNPRDPLSGPCLTAQTFQAAGLKWPVLNPRHGPPTEYANLVDAAICAANESTQWHVTRNGKSTGDVGTWMDCWRAIHKGSWGASVEWLMRHEGYVIVAV